jgi:hypothetical protein
LTDVSVLLVTVKPPITPGGELGVASVVEDQALWPSPLIAAIRMKYCWPLVSEVIVVEVEVETSSAKVVQLFPSVEYWTRKSVMLEPPSSPDCHEISTAVSKRLLMVGGFGWAATDAALIEYVIGPVELRNGTFELVFVPSPICPHAL